MDKVFELLARLSDGQPRTGTALAAAEGVTRAAIWERVKRLQALGVELTAHPGKGYQLAHPFEFLEDAAIRALLAPNAAGVLREITVSPVTDSTNQRLLDACQQGDIHGHAWLAEFQTAGRGRRGDRWLAPPGAAVCLSLGWGFDSPPRDLGALSLVVGIGVVRGLQALGAHGVGLKWPNDLLFDRRKLAGILIEMRSEVGGPCTVVIGVGVNVALGEAVKADIDQPAASLTEACKRAPSRNAIAAAVLSSLVETLGIFAARGFEAFVPVWRVLDALAGRRVQLTLPGRTVDGTARGVDANGLLLIEHDGTQEAFLAGHARVALSCCRRSPGATKTRARSSPRSFATSRRSRCWFRTWRGRRWETRSPAGCKAIGSRP